MRIACSAPLIAALVFTTATTLPATAQENSRPSFWQVFTLENMATTMFHSALSWARLLADIRYDQISVDPMAMRATLTGIRISPYLPHVAPGGCTILVERLTLNGRALDQIGAARLRLALDGVSVPSTCLPVEPGGMMRGFGYASLNVPRIEAEFNYDYPTGGADIRISADLDRLVSVNAAIDVDYFSYRLDFDTEEPVIAVDLNSAVLSVSDNGGWELAKKLLPPSMLEPQALAQIVNGALTQALAEGNGADIALSARQQAFADSAGVIASGFDAGRRQVVLATRINAGPLRLDEAAMQSFPALFDALDPVLQTFAPALNTAIPVAELSAALDAETPPDNAFQLGRALITGIGAPYNPVRGLGFLAPLARNGNADASLLIAKAVAQSKPKDAYAHALRAAAADKPGALALLDRIERDLPFADAIEAQNTLLGGMDDATYRDVSAMRRAARGYLGGTSRARSWRAAYYWSSMASATGDATGAALRADITEMMRLRGDAKAWAAETEKLDNGVLRDWIGRDVPGLLK